MYDGRFLPRPSPFLWRYLPPNDPSSAARLTGFGRPRRRPDGRGDAGAAIALYRGHFMDGVHVEDTAEELEEWMSAERRRAREDLTRALLTAAKSEVAAGRPEQAISFARRAVEIAPNDEGAHRA